MNDIASLLTGAGGTALVSGLAAIIVALVRRRRARDVAQARTEVVRIEAEATGRHRAITAETAALPAVEHAWEGAFRHLEEELDAIRPELDACRRGREEDRRAREEDRRACEERDRACRARLDAYAEALDEVFSVLHMASPAVADGARARLHARTTGEVEAASQRTVLVVDDDAATRRAIQRMVEQQDHRCVAVGSVAEALRELAGPTRIDAVLTDVRMPGLSGIDLLTRLRATSDVPVILMSGRPLEDGVLVPIDTPFVSKPLDAQTLAAALFKVLA